VRALAPEVRFQCLQRLFPQLLNEGDTKKIPAGEAKKMPGPPLEVAALGSGGGPGNSGVSTLRLVALLFTAGTNIRAVISITAQSDVRTLPPPLHHGTTHPLFDTLNLKRSRKTPIHVQEDFIMAYVITDACIKDSLCVDVCPTDCIHPKADDAKFDAATQLYVQPDGCIDCGACVPVCTSDAIHPIDDLTEEQKQFAAKNAEFFN
jgi:ferredoxin